MVLSLTTILGLVFLLLAFASTFLMFRFWGYPYDKELRKSACPQWKMNIHRAVGYAYAAVYVVMMIKMVPRLWQYQIEFPARTVAHVMLGMTIGVILLIKIAILRWYRHFEEWMPVLGVSMLLCTVLLLGLSVPFVVRLHVEDERAVTAENRARVRGLLDGAGLPAGTDLDALASERGLLEGRRVLLEKCVFCHDLKTAIARPRTPEDWLNTVERMAEKPTLGPRLVDDETFLVTSYLVAITPELQQSAKAKREEEEGRRESMVALGEAEGEATAAAGQAAQSAAGNGPPVVEPMPAAAEPAAAEGAAETRRAPAKTAAVDPAKAKATYEKVCSKCHDLSDTDDAPPRTKKEVDALITRMIENGLEAKKAELALVRAYLIEHYVR